MIGSVLALALLAAGPEAQPGVVQDAPQLDIDPCVAVDQSAVRTLMELQIPDGKAPPGTQMMVVSVRCVAEAQEITVEPWASLGLGGVRTIQLPPADEIVPASQEARSRELALAIAELIRRLELTHPLPVVPPSVPMPAPPAMASAVPLSVAPERAQGRSQLGVLSAFERFGGGQTLVGADVVLARRFGRFFVSEIRAGGRAGEDVSLPWTRVTTRAGTASAAAGASVWFRRRLIGVALMARAQGYIVEFQGAPAGTTSGSAYATGFTLAAEPRLFVALGRHVALTTGAAAGYAVHGVVLQTRGIETSSLTGVVLSATLGAVLTF